MPSEAPPEQPLHPHVSAAEAGLEQARRAVTPRTPVVLAIVAVNLAVFGAMISLGVDAFAPRPAALVPWGANVALLTRGGQPWRVITALFLHHGAYHLVANMVVLWYAGRDAERIFGPRRFAAIYLAAGICGGIATLAFHPRATAVGASGAILGIIGALGAYLVRQRGALPASEVSRLALVVFASGACTLVFGSADAKINVAAHVGGLLGGVVAGAFLVADRREASRRPGKVVACATGLLAAALIALPRPPSIGQVVGDFLSGEARIVAKYRWVLASGAARTLSDGEIAGEIEREVLVPWRALREELAAPAWAREEQEVVYAVMRYADDRDARWTAVVAALRSGGSTALAEIEELDAAAEAEAAAFREKMKRWDERAAWPTRAGAP